MKKFLLVCAAGMMATGAFSAVTVPEGATILLQGNQKGVDIVAWSDKISNTEVDGVACVQFVNEEAGDPWSQQLALDYNYEAGVTYYLTMDVMGTVSDVEISAWLQNNSTYATLGYLNGFKVESATEWNTVTISGSWEMPEEATEEDANNTANRMVINLGAYTGTLNMTQITIYSFDDNNGGDEGDGNILASFFTGNGKTFGGWGDATFENVEEDGKPCLKYTNETAKQNWEVQASIDYNFEVGQTYTLSFDIKGTPFEGVTAGYQGSGDVDGETHYDGKGDFPAFNITEEWQTVVISAECGEGNYPVLPASRVLFNLGNYVGTFYMTNVVLSLGEAEDQPGEEEPGDNEPLASFFTGNGKTFGGWGDATFENVDEDGKPSLKYTNETAKQNWEVQASIDYNFEAGETYSLSFDIKGTPFEGLTAVYQGAGDVDGETKYDGKGNFPAFNVTEEWQTVVITAECGEGEYPVLPATRILFNLGDYVGTLYITNVNLYAGEIDQPGNDEPGQDDPDSGVDMNKAENGVIVYNMMGVKVLESSSKAVVSTLNPGLYIINGKKVIVRR